jgi:hypothetical protein
MGVDEAEPEARMATGQGGRRRGDERAERGREARQPHSPRVESDVRGQLGGRGAHPAEDLRGPFGENLSGLRQPDAAADALKQHGACLLLQPGEMVAHRRLRVVELASGRGDGPVPRDGVQDAEASEVEHSSTLSMDYVENRH